MATVNEGNVVLFGAGGPVGAAAISALKNHYTLRVTDLRPMTEVAVSPPQSPRAPIPEVLGPPHENRVVDITDYAQVLAACEGMDAAINVSVVRPHPVLAFQVNMVGAYNVAKACVACGIKRLIHTGPFHTSLDHNADYWHDFQLDADIPLHPGDDLYALTKYLGGHVTRVFAEREGLEVLALCLYAVSARRGVARRIWARRTSLFDVVGGYGCGVFVRVASARDAGAL